MLHDATTLPPTPSLSQPPPVPGPSLSGLPTGGRSWGGWVWWGESCIPQIATAPLTRLIHALAPRRGPELLAEIPGVRLDLESVQTNMVWFELEEREGRSMEGLAEFLSERGMTTYPPMIWGLRFVTSSRVDEADVRALAEAVSEYARCPSLPSPTS